MPKDEIKKFVEDSKKVLEQEHDNFENRIKDDFRSFKKKTMDQI